MSTEAERLKMTRLTEEYLAKGNKITLLPSDLCTTLFGAQTDEGPDTSDYTVRTPNGQPTP